MQTGRVKFWHEKKGYGFIISDEGDKEFFVHFSAVISDDNRKTLTQGDRVTFYIDHDGGDKRGPRAVDVTVVKE